MPRFARRFSPALGAALLLLATATMAWFGAARTLAPKQSAAPPGCVDEGRFALAGTQGESLQVLVCDPGSGDEPSAPELRFIHHGPSGDTASVYALDADGYAPTTDIRVQLWDNRLLTVNLMQERGGHLVLAHWRGGTFAYSGWAYDSGDEETAALDFHDGALWVRTATDGTQRLHEDSTPGTETPHAFVPDALTCEHRDDALTTTLQLVVDTAGRVRALDYLTLTPASDGTAYSCSVQARRHDGDTAWSDAKDGLTTIAWNDANADDGGPPDASRLRLTRHGDDYTLDLRELRHASFCGQSAAMARSIALRKGALACTRVALSD